MADRLDLDAFVDVLLDSVPAEELDDAAIAVIGRAARCLALAVGSRAASALLYAAADALATRHVPTSERAGHG